MGALLLDTGDTAEGLEQLQRAADAQPRDADVQMVAGLAFAKSNRPEQAARFLHRVVAADPYNDRARFEYGVLLARSGQPVAAALEFAAVLANDPSRPSVHLNFAKALRESDRDGEALAALRRGLEHLPNHPKLLRSASWLLSTSKVDTLRDGEEALRIAQRLCELSAYANPEELQALAAACAESGDFDAAVSHASNALSLATTPSEARARLERQLARYRERQPLRE